MRAQQPDSDIAALQQRIAAAEDRLVARQLRLQAHLIAVRLGTREALRPRRLLTPLLGAGLAALVVRWIWRPLAAVLRPPRSEPPAPAAVPVGGLSWSELAMLAWPLLPARWRRHSNPATTAAAVSLCLPLLRRLFGRDPGAPLPARVAHVDPVRFAGTWYQIARLPQPFDGAGQPSTTFTAHPDGSGFEVLNRSPSRDGGERKAHGIACTVPGSGGAQLKVSLLPAWLRWWPPAWDEQWIIALASDYSMALVGDPGRRFLCVLARAPQLPAAHLQALVTQAAEQGYPVMGLHVAAAPDAAQAH